MRGADLMDCVLYTKAVALSRLSCLYSSKIFARGQHATVQGASATLRLSELRAVQRWSSGIFSTMIVDTFLVCSVCVGIISFYITHHR